MTPNFALDYFESREKPHTQKPQARICYRLETLAADLAAYLNQIEEPYHLMGASIGASSILQAWSNLKQKPQSLALLSPVINLQMPAYFRLFPYISERSVRLVRPLVLAMMKRSKAFAVVSRGLSGL